MLAWAESEGFTDYLKILEAEKVTGEKLLTMSKVYMEDVLGISNTSTQQKMTLLINESNKNVEDFNNYVVHGWGKNDKGQLCMNPSANINNPVRLKLPEHTELLSCFGDQTILRNNKSGEITINALDEQGKLHW